MGGQCGRYINLVLEPRLLEPRLPRTSCLPQGAQVTPNINRQPQSDRGARSIFGISANQIAPFAPTLHISL